jgi:DNA-binding transcriptional LysR family regulator
VLLLEQPDIRLEWIAMPFPRRDRPLLHGADVGLFLEPPLDPTLRSLVVDTSRMAVVMAVGHRLAHSHELRVADVLDEPFPDGDGMHPAWHAFWTLEAQRGAPAPTSGVTARSVEQALAAVAGGRAIATCSELLAEWLPHPGVISLPLVDGPRVTMRLVWREGDPSAAVDQLADIARDMFGDAHGGQANPPRTRPDD